MYAIRSYYVFSESMARAVIEVAPEHAAAFEAMSASLPCVKIGTVGGEAVITSYSIHYTKLSEWLLMVCTLTCKALAHSP